MTSGISEAPRWRPIPPVVVLAALILMTIQRLMWPGPVLITTPWSWLGIPVALCGLAISILAAGRFRRLRTNIQTFGRPDRLVTDGLFRLSRNPMYLGLSILLLGAAVLVGTVTALALAVLFMILADRWYIPFEERMMRRVFGEAYEVYTRRTRRWL